MSFSSPPRAQIVLKQEEKEITLKAVHVVSGNAHDTRYFCQCPVWAKFEENSYDAVQSVSYDGKDKNFVYSTEKKIKKKNDASTVTDPGFLLKVSNANKDWTPIGVRVDSKEMEGEVVFCRALISLDGTAKFFYSVVLLMNGESNKIQGRINNQRDMYRNSTWVGFDMMLLMERRMRLEEIYRKMEATYYNNDESSNDSSLEMPEM